MFLRNVPVADLHRLARIEIGQSRAFAVAHYPDNLSYPLLPLIRDCQASAGILAWDRSTEGNVLARANKRIKSQWQSLRGDFLSTLRSFARRL
jgi:hypothetical protein